MREWCTNNSLHYVQVALFMTTVAILAITTSADTTAPPVRKKATLAGVPSTVPYEYYSGASQLHASFLLQTSPPRPYIIKGKIYCDANI